MAVSSRATGTIDRPVEAVFRFWAEEHAENHPRWDPDIELWRESAEPMGLGSKLRRRNSRSGTPVDGSMEVIQWEPNEAVTFKILDGPIEMQGGADFESLGPDQTRLSIWAEIPAMDEAMTGPLTQAMERSIATIKEMLESGE